MYIDDRKPFEQRFDELKQDAQDWLPMWKELVQYIAPERGFFIGQQPNKNKGIDHKILIDATATKDLRVLASGMMGGLTSPSHPWFKLGISDRERMQYSPVKTWLDDVRIILMDIYSRSNVYNTFYTIYEEIGAFNTAAAYIGEDYQDVIRGRGFTIGEYYLGTGHDGRVNAFAREYWMTTGQIIKNFGIENVSSRVKSAYDNAKVGQWWPVYQLIEENDSRLPGKKGNRNLPFRSVYWEPGTEKNSVLRYSGYHEFPVVAPRWDTLGNDSYGRNGPGRLALGDSKTLQILGKDGLMGLDKVLDPPVQRPSDVDIVNTAPGGVTVKGDNPDNKIEALYQVQSPLQALESYIGKYQGSIHEAFFKDLFLLFTSLERSNVTATEIMEKRGEKLLQLGPVIERLEAEMLDPVIDRTYQIALRAGLLPSPPRELEGQDIKVEYISTLAQAQKMIGTTAIKETVAFAGNLAAVKPDILDKINLDEALERIGDMNGTPPDILRGDEEVNRIRKAREQAQQQQAAMQSMLTAAQGAKTLSETDTGTNNALTALLGGQS